MTLSLHKLLAGVGYEYLTRRVARLDTTQPGRDALAAYYTARGETPGVWVGSGMAGVDGLGPGGLVTAEQMHNLFADGLHPLAEQREQQARDAGASDGEAKAARRLGTPFRVPKKPPAFLIEVSRRVADEVPAGASQEAAAEVRAIITSQVAAEWFLKEQGRAPSDARELAAAVTRWSRPAAQPVAGFDLTFSPVKSVSALWAVAEPPVAALIAEAHGSAVADALRFVERQALFTREGTNGVRQVEVRGLVAAAFVHRDSRAGDPDLHTHVAVANKVQTLSGRWLAIDGRALYTAVVAASETYNTALEAHLGERLGLQFGERATTGQQRRPIREIVGVDPALNERWSSRRQAIDVRREELARRFQASKGRPPTREEAWQLAQQATLDTRDRKHAPRTLAEQRTTWRDQAEHVLAGPTAVQAMVTDALGPESAVQVTVDAAWVAATAAQVMETMEGERAIWTRSHVRAEALRRVRGVDLSASMAEHVTDLVVAEALNRSVALRAVEPVTEPRALQRSDGTSVYHHAYQDRFTSIKILDAEQRVIAAAGRRDGRRLDPAAVDVAVARAAAVDGVALNAGQASLVRDLAGSAARVQLALAPAGTGKTTALRVLADAWVESGGSILGLAPSAAAAAVLAENIGGPTDTLAKLVWSLDHPEPPRPPWLSAIGPGVLVVVDEAGLADTLSLDTVVSHVLDRGGSVRLVGDDRQLGAVGAGGLLRDLDAGYGAARLSEVVRFTDPAEAAASLALRDGRPEALGFYLDQGRVHVGDPTTTADQLFDGWTRDRAAGLDSLMLAPTNALAADLNGRARAVRLGGNDPGHVTLLADGNQASEGDVVLTRANDRRLRASRGGWVRNGDRWVVTAVHDQGGLDVRSVGGDRVTFLPPGYVSESVQLGYASTVHSAQGVTCHTMHGLVTGTESRPHLYTLLTRGRAANHLYLQLGESELHDLARPGHAPALPTEILEQILARNDTAQSATTHQATLKDPAIQLAAACDRYTDALRVAATETTTSTAAAQVATIAEQLLPGLTQQAAWPALQTDLLLTDDPVRQLRLAVACGPLSDAHDPAAVLDQRVTNSLQFNSSRGGGAGPGSQPLPWLPRIPGRLQQHPTWGPYLTARSTYIASLAAQIRTETGHRPQPAWAKEWPSNIPQPLVAEIEVWRAATDVKPDDLAPTGTHRHTGLARRWQDGLDRQLTTDNQQNGWAERLTTAVSQADSDPFLHRLAQRLSRLAATGVDIEQHLRTAANEGPLPDDHPAAALWWRLHRYLPQNAELTHARQPMTPSPPEPATSVHADTRRPTSDEIVPASEEATIDTALLIAGFLRLAQGRSTTPTIDREARAANQSPTDPTLRSRLLTINRWTLDFYRSQFPGSWSKTYLTERCGVDLTDDERFQPGHAPRGGRALTRHLHSRGVTETEMIAAGVAARTTDGHLIDRFRDRLILPIHDADQDLVGFVARRHPIRIDTDGGPKYLNTPTTALFSKGDHLYGSHPTATRTPSDPPGGTAAHAGTAVPVLVEGPIDAIAVTLAGESRYLGLSPLGTALTSNQATHLAQLGTEPMLATDSDPAGMAAAERDFWLLAQHRCDPTVAALPHQLDPGDVLAQRGAAALRQSLDRATPMGDRLVDRLTHPTQSRPAREVALRTIAARPPDTWNAGLQEISRRLGTPEQVLRKEFLPLVQEWTRSPDLAAQQARSDRRAANRATYVEPERATDSPLPDVHAPSTSHQAVHR